jgi:uncharacterized protein (TIGR01244 family)
MRKTISQRVSVGEQPRKADLEELKKDGVTTVVNLRVVGEETPLTPAEERALAEQLGLQYHQLPISLDKLNAAQVKELREILENSEGQVFVHCGLGQRACVCCDFWNHAEGMDLRPGAPQLRGDRSPLFRT